MQSSQFVQTGMCRFIFFSSFSTYTISHKPKIQGLKISICATDFRHFEFKEAAYATICGTGSFPGGLLVSWVPLQGEI